MSILGCERWFEILFNLLFLKDNDDKQVGKFDGLEFPVPPQIHLSACACEPQKGSFQFTLLDGSVPGGGGGGTMRPSP